MFPDQRKETNKTKMDSGIITYDHEVSNQHALFSQGDNYLSL